MFTGRRYAGITGNALCVDNGRHAKGSDDSVLIVGAGPAGLEAARGLGQRGYRVALAEATTGLGGRVSWESGLPGLAAWARVRDWRVGRRRI